jgi:hypothetical protein
MSEDILNPQVEQPQAEAMAVDLETILEEYRRRQMLAHLTGPIISVVLHAVVLTLCFFFLVAPERTEIPEIEVTIKEMKPKELDPKTLEALDRIEARVEDVVPTVTRPDVPSDAQEPVSTEDFSDNMASTDSAVDMSAVLDIKANTSPLKLSGLYGGRTDEGRRKIGTRYGMTVVTESAVLRALRWLKKMQQPDGSWSTSRPAAMSGLALLTFLAHGETPESEEFGMTVQKAMQYLADKMVNSRGILEQEYSHGIATYALAEAYGMTGIPFLKPAMEKGLRTLIDGQQFTGGWDYGYKKGERWDLSVAGWQIQALKAGFIANADIPELLPAIEKSIAWLKSENYEKGFRYSNGGGSSLSMQGVGALCLQLLGEGNAPQARAAVNAIVQSPGVQWTDNLGAFGPYAWYYQTQAIFHEGQGPWKKWNAQFTKELTRSQKPDGHWSVPGEGHGAGEYEPYMTTCFSTMMLTVYYRFLPTFKLDLKRGAGDTGLSLDVDGAQGLDLRVE